MYIDEIKEYSQIYVCLFKKSKIILKREYWKSDIYFLIDSFLLYCQYQTQSVFRREKNEPSKTLLFK